MSGVMNCMLRDAKEYLESQQANGYLDDDTARRTKASCCSVILKSAFVIVERTGSAGITTVSSSDTVHTFLREGINGFTLTSCRFSILPI